MRIEQIDLLIVRLPLVRPFQTSSSRKTHLDHILVRIVADGVAGWGECASPSDPYYCPETTETCWHILHDFLGPLVLGREWSNIDELVALYRLVKGNAFAQGRTRDGVLGRTRPRKTNRCGRSWVRPRQGPFWRQPGNRTANRARPGPDRAAFSKKATGASSSRSRPVGTSRWCARCARYPEIPLQVDANSAYTLDDMATLKALDDFDLILIEQPLAHDDIIDHARVQSVLKTPICLDESIHSADDARKALDLGACRVINIKVSRLGGLREARRVHDLCPRAQGAGVVRGHARIWDRPRGQRGDRRAAGLHAPRRYLGLRQVLRRGYRRTADPGS